MTPILFYFVIPSGLDYTYAIAFALSLVTYFLAPLMRSIPKDEIAGWAIVLRNDALISMIAIGSVSALQALMKYVSAIVTSGLPPSFTSNPTDAYLVILTQLGTIDGVLVLLIGAVSAIPLLSGVGVLLGNMLGSLAMFVTNSIVLWSIIQLLSNTLQTLFLTFWGLGLIAWSMPYRIGRTLGSHILASMMVLSIGLPLAAPAALWVEQQLATHAIQKEFENFAGRLTSNPLLILKLMSHLTMLVGKLIASVLIALLIFPLIYLSALGFLIRGLATLMGGSSPGLVLIPR
jgi:hypothetical protein